MILTATEIAARMADAKCREEKIWASFAEATLRPMVERLYRIVRRLHIIEHLKGLAL